MGVKTLRSLEIGDKVTLNPSWTQKWQNELTVVSIGQMDNGRYKVSIRRQESEDVEPTYDLVDDGSRVSVYGAIRGPYRKLGRAYHLEHVGKASRIKVIQLRAKAGEFDRDDPGGDDSWANYYNRTPAGTGAGGDD